MMARHRCERRLATLMATFIGLSASTPVPAQINCSFWRSLVADAPNGFNNLPRTPLPHSDDPHSEVRVGTMDGQSAGFRECTIFDLSRKRAWVGSKKKASNYISCGAQKTGDGRLEAQVIARQVRECIPSARFYRPTDTHSEFAGIEQHIEVPQVMTITLRTMADIDSDVEIEIGLP